MPEVWQSEAERLKFDEKLSWREVAVKLQGYFPDTDLHIVYERIRKYIRGCPQYKAQRLQTAEADMERSMLQYQADGSIVSEKFITLRDGDELTPSAILEAHGLKPSMWEVVSYKNNFWNSQLKGGIKQISYQSKLTAKPQVKPFDFDEIDKHFKELDRTYKPEIILPSTQTGNFIAEVNIADLHFGRLCWHGDTGNNYDYKIARQVYQQIISDACNKLKGMPIEYIVFPIGNDLINSDTPDKTTTAGTPQDTDIRWQKLIDTATEMVIAGIDMLKTVAPVKAFYVASNHDEVSTYGLVNTVSAWFRNDKRVEIDKTAISRKYRLYGNTLVGYSHGNNERPTKGTKDNPCKLAALMPIEARQMWAQAKYSEFHAAHLHSEHATEEINGVIVRRISSPTASDTWTFESGYVGAVRKAQVFVYDKEYGLSEILMLPVRD